MFYMPLLYTHTYPVRNPASDRVEQCVIRAVSPMRKSASRSLTTVRYSIASTSCRMHGIVFLLFTIR